MENVSVGVLPSAGVVGGVDLAKRDVDGSDAYVVVCIGEQVTP